MRPSLRRLALFPILLLIASVASAGDNWPQFLGPGGDADAGDVRVPLEWSETKNVVWKTPIPGRAWSSPVVWGGQIWFTDATEDGHEMYAVCLDKETGAVLHRILLFTPAQLQEMHALNSFASPTPVIEEGRVWVNFGNYGVACLDTATGDVLWKRTDINCDHFRGPGSSPVLFEDLLIYPMDGIDVQYVIALNKATGETVWKTPRSTDFRGLDGDFRKAYSTPTVIEVDGKPQLVSTGAEATIAYDPRTGEELWKHRIAGFSNVGRPMYKEGLLLLNSGFTRAVLSAVRPTGLGDITDTHVDWTFNSNVGIKSSAIVVDGLIYTAFDQGIVTCVELDSGKPLWRERFGGEFSATPLHAAGRIYFFPHEGPAKVIQAGRDLEVLAVNELDAGFMASPAVTGNALILRTEKAVYRIEEK